MKKGKQHRPLSAPAPTSNHSARRAISNNIQVQTATNSIGHPLPATTMRYIHSSLSSFEIFLKYASRKLISNDNLRFSQIDTWAILNATARLKSEKFMLAELQLVVAEHIEPFDSPSFVVLIDRRGRPAVPETTLKLFRKALTPGKTIHGKKKLRVDVLVPETLWEAFLIKAMGWWVDSGKAPGHIAEMQLEMDLGL